MSSSQSPGELHAPGLPVRGIEPSGDGLIARDPGPSVLLMATEQARGYADHICDLYLQGGTSVALLVEQSGVSEAVVVWWLRIASLPLPHPSDRPLSLTYFDAPIRMAAEARLRARVAAGPYAPLGGGC